MAIKLQLRLESDQRAIKLQFEKAIELAKFGKERTAVLAVRRGDVTGIVKHLGREVCLEESEHRVLLNVSRMPTSAKNTEIPSIFLLCGQC